MARLSLSRAWDEAREVLSRDGKLIGAVALALFYLPGVVAAVARPEAEGLPKTGGELLMMAVVAIIGIIGQLAVIRLALGTRSTVGEAIGHGVRRMPVYFLASVIWLLPFMLGLYFVGGDLLRAPETANLTSALVALLILGGLMFVSIRMLMTSSVASAEPAGPLAILQRSWALTSGHWWRLFGFVVLFLIVAIASLTAIGAVAGIISALLFGEAQPMTLAALFIALFVELVTTLVTVGFLVMLARIYAQLSGPAHADVSVPSSGT